MPEKLLNIKDVAKYLNVSEEEVKRLVDIGEVPAYRIGGSFLRFRKEQIDAIQTDVSDIEKEKPEEVRVSSAHPYSELEREIKRKEPVTRQYDYTSVERIRDFFYFYDFYILSFVLIGILLYVIFQKT
jgi:excisionase family DNA binding protein